MKKKVTKSEIKSGHLKVFVEQSTLIKISLKEI